MKSEQYFSFNQSLTVVFSCSTQYMRLKGDCFEQWINAQKAETLLLKQQ